jgi:hypothetical protein
VAQGQLNSNLLRPYRGWAVINHREQSYMSNYHGLQLGLSRSFSRGFSTQVAYTWSKNIDNADFSGGIYGFVPNTRDSSGERGRASLDCNHNFVASYIWEVPFLKDRRDLVGRVFGGWQISGITSIRTGLPISPELGRDIAGVGSSARQRPLASGSPVLGRSERSINQWFDPSVYSAPAFGTFSPVARNIMSGPGWNVWDVSFAKFIPVTESTRLEIRADSFNLFNHTQWNGVGTSFFVPSAFGRVTSTRNERSFMLGARLEF